MTTAAPSFLCGLLCLSFFHPGAWAGDTDPLGRGIELTCSFSIHNLPENADKIVVWAPIPQTNEIQHLRKSQFPTDIEAKIVQDSIYGNSFHRMNLSNLPRENGRITTITVRYDIVRLPLRTGIDPPLEHITSAPMTELLAPDRLVPTTGKIKAEAELVAGEMENPFKASHALFENLISTMRYDKSGTGWGRGDALYACDSRTGNCTDFHSLFIGESRALGIPAIFVAGLTIPSSSAGAVNGYHCWAQFYVENRGWFPLDASEADKHPERKAQLFGGLDANRIAMTVGRDLRLPGANGASINFIVYPYVEVDGASYGDINCIYHYRELENANPSSSNVADDSQRSKTCRFFGQS